MSADSAQRAFKDRLYGQFARVGKALGNPLRLELLEFLAQGERTVDALAGEVGTTMANASQHLQALREAGLDEGVARELAPRHAFARACRKLSERRIIRPIAEDADTIRFQFTAGREEVPALVSALVSRGVKIVGLQEEKTDLESLFMRLTKGEVS